MNNLYIFIIHIYTSYPFFHFFPTLYSVQYTWYYYSIICILKFSLSALSNFFVNVFYAYWIVYIFYQSDIGLLISRQILLVSDSAGLVWLVDMTEKQTPARQTCTGIQQPSAITVDWLNNLAYIADRNFVSNNKFVVSVDLSVSYINETWLYKVETWYLTFKFIHVKLEKVQKCEISSLFIFLERDILCKQFLWHFLSPRLLRKRGTLKLIRSSVCLSLCLSVTKTLSWLISSKVLTIEHWYLACMILVTGPFNWHHAVTLTFDLDLYFKVKVVAEQGSTILWICLFHPALSNMGILAKNF